MQRIAPECYSNMNRAGMFFVRKKIIVLGELVELDQEKDKY